MKQRVPFLAFKREVRTYCETLAVSFPPVVHSKGIRNENGHPGSHKQTHKHKHTHTHTQRHKDKYTNTHTHSHKGVVAHAHTKKQTLDVLLAMPMCGQLDMMQGVEEAGGGEHSPLSCACEQVLRETRKCRFDARRLILAA